MASEFDVIRRHFRRPQHSPDVVLGSGDDAALLQPRPDQHLVVTTDAQVEGVHFRAGTAAADVGWKSLAVNLSDLAAMGAEPAAFTCALTLPQVDENWLEDFADGLYALADAAGIALVGGNISRGALSITIAAMGWCAPGQALRRDAGQPGDKLCVTGTLGDAALAYVNEAAWQLHGNAQQQALLQRLQRPQARWREGRVLAQYARCGIDLSDGLAADVQHLMQASGCGARLQAAHLPASAAFQHLCPPQQRLPLQLAGGEDYELCVALPESAIAPVTAQLDCRFTVIGELTATRQLVVVDAEQTQLPWNSTGFQHFP